MWIFLGILAFIAALIIAILLLPVYIIIKSDDNDTVVLYKFFFKTFGENPDPNNPIIRVLKEATGISQLKRDTAKENIEQSGVLFTVKDYCRILLSLFEELVKILKFCTVKKLELKVICSGDDAADAAVNYGGCCTLAYPLVGFINSAMKVRKGAQKVDISCNFDNKEEIFEFDALISVKFCRVFAAFLRIAYKQAQRTFDKNKSENQSL